MKIGFEVSGGAPGNTYALQEATASGFDAVEAAFHQEHDADGLHSKPFESLTVAGQSQLLGGSILAALLALDDGYANTLTATTNNLAQADGSPIQDVVIRLQASTPISLTGIVPFTTTQRQVHLIENGGSASIRLEQNHSGSTDGNRFSLPGELDLDLESGACVLIQYDIHSNIWRTVQAGTPMGTVQRGTIAFLNGGPNIVDATIASLDFDSAEVRFLGWKSDAQFFCSVRLLDDSHVRAERDNSFNSVNATASYEVTGRLL